VMLAVIAAVLTRPTDDPAAQIQRQTRSSHSADVHCSSI
jgi:hypothetical protein